MFGFCITHILNTGCNKIWKKKIRRQKVNIPFTRILQVKSATRFVEPSPSLFGFV